MGTPETHEQLLKKIEQLELENLALSSRVNNQICEFVFDSAKDGILVLETIYGVPSTIIRANKSFLAELNYNHDELLQLDPLDLLATGQKKKLLNISDQILNNGSVYFNTIFLSRSKVEIPVEVTISVMNGGDNPNIVCIIRNINARNKELEKNPSQIDRLKKITEGTNEVVFQMSLKPTITFEYISPASGRILGYKPSEIYSNKELFFGHLHPEDKKKILSTFTEVSTHIQPIKVRYLRRDEKMIWIELYLTAEVNKQGKITAYDGIIHDITHRHQMERMHNKKLLIENLIAKVSTRFIDYKNFYKTIKEVITEIGEILNLDSITLYLCNLAITSFEHNWKNPNCKIKIQDVALASLPTISNKLNTGELVYLAENTSIKLASFEQEIISELGVKSLLASPLLIGDNYIGYLSFTQYGKTKIWDRVDIHLISTLTNIVNQTIRKEVIIRQKDRLFKRAIELGLLTSEPHNCYPSAIFSIRNDSSILGCLNAGFFNTAGNFKRFENLTLSEVFMKANHQEIMKRLKLALKSGQRQDFSLAINQAGSKIPYLCQMTKDGANKVLLCFYPNC